MHDLVLFGAGGHGREMHDLVEDINATGRKWNLLGFLDDDASLHDTEVHGLPVLGGAEWLDKHRYVYTSIAIGSTTTKEAIVRKLKAHSKFATLIHPSVYVGTRVTIGEGTLVSGGSRITTDVFIGRHVIVNVHCTVMHDCIVEDFVTLAPNVNLSGGTVLKEGCDLGTNAVILPGITVGGWAIVGAGAVVIEDLPGQVTAVGVPAKPI